MHIMCCSPLKRRRVEDTCSVGDDAAALDAPGVATTAEVDPLGSAASDAAGIIANGDREMVDMAEDIEDVAALPPQVSGSCC
jgi:hypothetical protein